MASAIAYVENFLNLTNGYYNVTSSEADQIKYLVPFPPEYNITIEAYWTTDVIVFDPSCSWQTATKPDTGDVTWDVTLTIKLSRGHWWRRKIAALGSLMASFPTDPQVSLSMNVE